ANGIALHGGFLPYTSTFLMFVEYARNAVRAGATAARANSAGPIPVYVVDINPRFY
ncbi:hypothetical protein FK514_27290, partial [Klebsiella pneumoniae]|nr:hypothetical protein [Klebsiella pneumoniae]